MRRATVVVVAALVFAMLPLASASALAPNPIVYVDAYGSSGLYTAQPDLSNKTHLEGTRRAAQPHWKPDGTGFAYVGDAAILWADADGSNQHVLIGRRAFPEGWVHVSGLDWSPDGAKLAVGIHTRKYRHVRAFVVDVATRDFTTLLRGGNAPDWSAGAGRIVLTRHQDIVSVLPDGSGLQVIWEKGRNSSPAWSPYGTKIAFVHFGREGQQDIDVIDADGSNRVNLTHSPQWDWAPTWSPNGTRIMWSRSKEAFTYADMLVMHADGSSVVRLTHTDRVDEYEPDWLG